MIYIFNLSRLLNFNFSNSIYKLPLINEELNIVDFEINSLSVHVIPTFDKAKNANVYIPSLYKQYHFKPDMFLFVNFSKTFAKMEILGFITEPDLKMLTLPKAVLVSPDNLASTIETLVPRQNKISTGTIETTKELTGIIEQAIPGFAKKEGIRS